MGKNLYSKGACYAAAVRDGQREWEYVYLGDNEMKLNVSLKVSAHGAAEFYTLISAGVSWYEAGETARCFWKARRRSHFGFGRRRADKRR